MRVRIARARTGEAASAALWFVVTYRDPDGELAYCYNTETASIRLHLYERTRRVGGWAHAAAMHAHGRANFVYGQRTPVPELELHLT